MWGRRHTSRKSSTFFPKSLANRLLGADDRTKEELAALVEREASPVIEKMQAKGYSLVTRLDTGEGVFVRENDVVGLHIQLPTSVYQKLEAECHRRETTKRNIVISALEQYFQTEKKNGGVG